MAASIEFDVHCDARACGRTARVRAAFTLNHRGKMILDEDFELPIGWGRHPDEGVDTPRTIAPPEPRVFCERHAADWSQRKP